MSEKNVRVEAKQERLSVGSNLVVENVIILKGTNIRTTVVSKQAEAEE